jgi:hypothetical protein
MTEPESIEPTEPRTDLRARLQAMRDQLAAGDHNTPRTALYGDRWCADVDVAELPAEILGGVTSSTEAAHAALSRWPPDLYGAGKALDQALERLG